MAGLNVTPQAVLRHQQQHVACMSNLVTLSADTEATKFAALSGNHLLQDQTCSYPPSVETSDALEVNFDRKLIGPDGMYLIAYPATGHDPINCAWGGIGHQHYTRPSKFWSSCFQASAERPIARDVKKKGNRRCRPGRFQTERE